MMPPTRIEQLNNFQDAVQSPDGLDRLRALQSIEQALPSSQGLMGMPQVQAPMPIVPRQYGGEVGTGGLVEVLNDGTQVFSNTEEGILNRSLHGGMLQGQQQTATAPSSFSGGTDAPGTLASGTSAAPAVLPKTAVDSSFLSPVMDLENVQQRGGIYNASDIRDAGITLSRPSDAPQTIIPPSSQTTYRDPVTGKIPYALYQPQPVNTFGQGYDLKDMDYFTANALALSEGADRFIYNDEYAAVDPGLLSNYNYSELGTKPYSSSMELDRIRENTVGMPQTIYETVDTPEVALAKAQGYTMGYSGQYNVPGTPPAERYRQLADSGVNMDNPYTRQMFGFKHGGSLSDTAEGLASFGRYGDNILVHMNPEELSGLASLGQITYNPVTGLPEAFSLKGLFKGIRKLAPIALAIAAPYALGAGGLGLIGSNVAGMSALQFGLATGLGSFVGNKIAGAKTGDALKAGLMSGVMGGVGKGFSSGNWMESAGAKAGELATTAAPTAGQNLVQSTITGNPSYGGTLVNPASEFTSSAANIGTTTGPASLAGQEMRLAQLRPQAFAAQSQAAYGVTPQIQAGQAMTAPQLQNIINQGPQTAIAGPGGMFVEDAATGVYKGSTQAAPTNMIERIQQSPLVTDTSQTIKNLGSQIYKDYANPTGIAKIVAGDLMTPDYDVMYANEARAKEQQLKDAGYTVDTGFDGQVVIKDSSGVTLPRNLTASMILDRALGRTPRTNLVARTDYATAKQGGLISLKHGGEFSGMVPGEGHGMEDNVYMPITEGPKQVGTLAVSPSEYVVDSYTMAALGNGNADAGAKVMDRVVKHVRKKAYGDTEQPNEISGLQALKPMMERV